jgi:hypothetical protein
MPEVRLDQATIDYRVLRPPGSAHPPMVFVHSVPVDHRPWTKVVEGLAAQGFRRMRFEPDVVLQRARDWIGERSTCAQ